MGIAEMRTVAIKVPSDEGRFSLWYRVTCEGFDSGYDEFKVVVT